MKKITFAEYGSPDVLQLIDAGEPHAGPDQVRIAVRAAGVNPVDWRIREGQFATSPLDCPVGLGQDAAGVVDEVGDGVVGVRVGDPVFGVGRETYAEFAVLDHWTRIPEDLRFDEAAGYPSVMETALRILGDVGARAGETVLISGAAGGVGSAVVQVAVSRGIQVIGTASAANQEYLLSLGAQATTYDEGWTDRVRALGVVDAALDVAGSGVLQDLVELTGDPRRVVSIADRSGEEVGVRFTNVAGSMPDALEETVRLIEGGALHIPIARAYPLRDAARAHADSQAGHTRGRRVLVVD